MRTRNYRFLIVLIAAAIITIFSFPAMATDVGGIIDTDTIWDLAGSPYNIVSDVQIADSATLTIEPGVVVSSGRIEVWGILQIIGSVGEKITLNSITIEGQENSFLIQIQYAIINRGTPCASGSGNGSVILKDSMVSHTQQIRRGNKILERNIFINTDIIWVSDGDQIFNNVFYNPNSDYILVSYGSTDVSTIIVRYNSFLGRGAIRVWSSGDMTATENFWNTTDTAVIDSMIVDRNDDLEADNFVEYDPFLTEPHPDTPIPNFNQSPTSNSGDDQAVYDQVTLNGTRSFDPDGSIVSYEWSLQHRTNSVNDRIASGANPTLYDLNPGFYDVYLTVTDDGGLVDTDNMLLAVAGSCFCTPSTFHIEMIEPNLLKADKGEKFGQALVKVMDDCGNAISGATVYGTFSGDFSESINGQTGGDGNIMLTTTVSTKGKPGFTFCVDDLINGTLTYVPADNVETCDSYQ